ncbi:PE family protein [Mycobacterium conspicuum]|jgi:hypothetical protein|uniref:Uncharacterized protein n=1 Tax=Mycobacterium conspicuum TaxID=44010 RepID=A0A1X1T3K7_9MYCO|nr:PE family protein [Mycobacterium conspicuum]ORV39164.1 hypothetical protein AWC00_18820 [Mycobacterium conspicuum]BBZ39343.1 hypothetical protein MCNS_24060 [Mycobacterium conspicuum]
MSFVSTMPELIESAAGDLENLRSTLGAATATATPPTAGIVAAAQDEVSVAVAALFSAHARQFHSLSARASAFHGQFVRSLQSSAEAYLSAETANAQQVVADVQSAIGSITGAPALLRGAADSSNPYEELVANTSANLRALRAAIAANPAPVLHQFLANQQAYAQQIFTAIDHFAQNFPESVPIAIQAFFDRLAAFNPVAFVEQVINNQLGYAHTIGTALSHAAHDFTVGLQALPAAFESALQDVFSGNIGGAVSTLSDAFVNLFFTGFSTVTSGSLTNFTAVVTPTGTLGDLLPILGIPGEMAQNFTNFLVPGSVAAQMAQNVTNAIETFNDTSIVANAGLAIRIFPPAVGFFLNAHFGMPITLLLEAAGGPVNALHAADLSARAFTNALRAGDFGGAFDALVGAPAVITNGLLNGELIAPISFNAGGYPVTIDLPLNGLLVPATPYKASVTVTIGNTPFTATTNVGGTPISGLVPALMTYVPEQLAEAIGA